MREQLKQQLRDMIATLGRAEGILDSKSKKRDEDAVKQLLEDMQNSAIALGDIIEEEEGLETETVEHLEEYCELLWKYFTAEELTERFRLGRELAGRRAQVSASLEEEVEGRIEAVFLLCKADRWKAMEPLWRSAGENPVFDRRVLVSPYCAYENEGEAGIIHGELEQFPDYAGAMDCGDYDMEAVKPDIVFLDGPYAGPGGTGDMPLYDFARVRESAGVVIYMPEYRDESRVGEADCGLLQVKEADMVIVQSDKIREAYVRCLRRMEKGAEICKKVSVMGADKAYKVFEKLM